MNDPFKSRFDSTTSIGANLDLHPKAIQYQIAGWKFGQNIGKLFNSVGDLIKKVLKIVKNVYEEYIAPVLDVAKKISKSPIFLSIVGVIGGAVSFGAVSGAMVAVYAGISAAVAIGAELGDVLDDAVGMVNAVKEVAKEAPVEPDEVLKEIEASTGAEFLQEQLDLNADLNAQISDLSQQSASEENNQKIEELQAQQVVATSYYLTGIFAQEMALLRVTEPDLADKSPEELAEYTRKENFRVSPALVLFGIMLNNVAEKNDSQKQTIAATVKARLTNQTSSPLFNKDAEKLSLSMKDEARKNYELIGKWWSGEKVKLPDWFYVDTLKSLGFRNTEIQEFAISAQRPDEPIKKFEGFKPPPKRQPAPGYVSPKDRTNQEQALLARRQLDRRNAKTFFDLTPKERADLARYAAVAGLRTANFFNEMFKNVPARLLPDPYYLSLALGGANQNTFGNWDGKRSDKKFNAYYYWKGLYDYDWRRANQKTYDKLRAYIKNFIEGKKRIEERTYQEELEKIQRENDRLEQQYIDEQTRNQDEQNLFELQKETEKNNQEFEQEGLGQLQTQAVVVSKTGLAQYGSFLPLGDGTAILVDKDGQILDPQKWELKK